MSQASAQSSQENRHGLLHLDTTTLWKLLPDAAIEEWQGQLKGWTGKAEELRRNLPVLDLLNALRENELELLRTLALELRANCDDILLLGSAQLLELARMQELFDGPGGRGPRLHLLRSKAWPQQLLPALEGIHSRVGLVVLGWCPGEVVWERGLQAALGWMRERYQEDELQRRVIVLSWRPVTKMLDCPLRHLPVTQRAYLAPIFSGLGLFPLYLAGFEANSLLEGARSQVRTLEKNIHLQHATVRYAVARQVLMVQENWTEAVITSDSYLEPLGLWTRRLFESSSFQLEPPPPYPFPHFSCQEQDIHPGARQHCYEFQLDYASPELDIFTMDRGRPRCWMGLPRLDLYTLGGAVALLTTAVAFNHRWNDTEPPSVEVNK